MAVRTAYVPVAGTAITAANHIKFPGGWIGYNEVTANQTGLAGGADLTGLSLTVTVGTSRRIRVVGYVGLQGGTGGDLARLDIEESAAVLNSAQIRLETSVVVCCAQVVLTPSSGSHTYNLAATRTSGSGTLQLTASAAAPSFILVEDLGPAS